MGVLVLRTIIARLMPSHRVHTRPARGDATPVRLSESPETLARYLEDAAHYPGGHAVGVAHPETEAEAAAVVRQAQRLLPIGAQSSLTGGATPMGEVVLTTERLDRIVEVGETEVTVQAGVPLTLLRETLEQRGALYPPIPTFEGAFAGGVVATNAAGAGTFKYGSTRDWVRHLTVILADGSVLDLTRGQVRAHPDGYFEIVTDGYTRRVPVPTYEMPAVPKRSAGYFAAPAMDLVDLFVGSEGTLGVVTEITFAIVPRCPSTCLVWIPVPSEAEAIALVATLRSEAQSTWRSRDPRGIDVAAIEHLDRRSLDLVKEDGVDRTHRVEISDDIAVAILAQIELPPDTVPSPDQAYAQMASALDAGSPDTPLVRLCRLLAQAGVADRTEIALPQDRRRHAQLMAIREAVPEAVNRRVGRAQRDIDPAIKKTAADMIVPFDRFAESVQLFRTAFEDRRLDYAMWGHISDGNVHPNVIPRSLDDVRRGNEAILACGRDIIELGGCPLAEHGVGRNPVKQALLQQLYGESGIEQMRRLKAAVDPEGKLSPGVLFRHSP